MDNESSEIKRLYDVFKKERNRANLTNIINFNIRYLFSFKEYLISKHTSSTNMNTYIECMNYFLNKYLILEMKFDLFNGIDSLNDFFSFHFVHKYANGTVQRLKDFITSIKNFYKFMFEKGNINKETYEYLQFLLKEEKDNWINKMKDYEK